MQPPGNPDRGPDPVRHLADGCQRNHPMPAAQARRVFREMALWELHNGALTARRRRRLVKYAAALHLSAVDAGRLIQEAKAAFESQYPQPSTLDDKPDLRFVGDLSEPPAWLVWVRLAVLLVVVGAAELILFRILSG